jgi:nucleoside 2-deoxyribosyltransferase
MEKFAPVLIVGEVVIDFTLAQSDAECKLRLGGIVHAARGLWAAEQPYSVAAVCPRYIVDDVRAYLDIHGCKEFFWLGDVIGSPNVIVIGEPLEVSHQGYEDLLRDGKRIKMIEPPPDLSGYEKVVVFPGKFDTINLLGLFSPSAKFTFDVAYDIDNLSVLKAFHGRIGAIIISTSSGLFMELGKEKIENLLSKVEDLSPEIFLLKENRGGSRLFNLADETTTEIPAILGRTVNSVGVGDVYSAVMVGLSQNGWAEAAWRGCQAATAYSQTTYPDDLRLDIQRAFKLSFDSLRALSGTILPWHDRQSFSIYIAGPDFSYVHKPELDRAVGSLRYHNFKVRLPVQENGEIIRPGTQADLVLAYHKDYQLLKDCDLVFAVPLERDPGTLVEVGMAISLGKPVITYDPRAENNNTMVVVGSVVYSSILEECLNGVFDAMAKLRAKNI